MTVAALEIAAEIFAANLNALRAVDPALAERLAAVDVERVHEPAIARDGCVSIRLRGSDGSTHWLGRTSMPTISAPAIVSMVEAGEAGVALPGIGHGLEARLLLDRLAPQQPIFAFDDDVVRLTAALRLNDLAEAVRTQRLIILAQTGMVAALDDFLSAQPGMLFPQRMVQWPWLTVQQTQRFASDLEQAYLGHQRRRRTWHAELGAALSARAGRGRPPNRICCVVHVHRAGAWTDYVLEGLPAAAAELGWQVEAIDSRRPEHGDPLVAAEAVVHSGADFVLLLNAARGDGAAALPSSVPVVSWYLEPGLAAQDVLPAVAPGDVVCAVNHDLAQYLGEAARAAPVRVLPLGACPAVAEPQEWESGSCAAGIGDCDVVMVQDGADLAPEASGLTLGTQAALWQVMCRVFETQADALTGDWPARLVELACRQVRLEIQDQAVRRMLARRFAARAAPTLTAIAGARDLTAAGCRVRLVGSGWERHPTVADWQVPRPCGSDKRSPSGLRQALRGVPLLVECDPRVRWSPAAFAALDVGCLPIVRAVEGGGGGRMTQGGPDEGVPPDGPTWRRAIELRKIVRDLLRDPAQRRERLARVRDAVGREHTLARRLERISQLLRT